MKTAGSTGLALERRRTLIHTAPPPASAGRLPADAGAKHDADAERKRDNDTGATLTIANHTGAWWFKETQVSAQDCTEVSAGTTTGSASYQGVFNSFVYKAYSASGCASANEIASVSFGTIGMAPPQGFYDEGESGSIRVTLPVTLTGSANVTVTLTNSNTTALTLDKTTCTFIPQSSRTCSVFFTTQQDTDYDRETAIVTGTASGGGGLYSGSTDSSTITVRDDDGIVLSTSPVALTEGGGTGTFTVKLAGAPTENVTVTVRSLDTGAVTRSPGTLTFTPENYNTAQTVTLTPVDDTDSNHESVDINVTAAGGGYNSVASVTAIVADDEGTSLAASAVEDDTATLTIANHTTAWRYKYTKPTGGSCSAQIPAGTTTVSLTGLSTGTSYTFKAYSASACSTELTSDATDAKFLTKPGQVTGVAATAGNAQLAVSWTALTGTVTGYKVQWKSGNQSYAATRQKVTTGTSTTITGLTNGTAYAVQVTAYNDTGDGDASAEQNGTPGPSLAASAVEDDTATLTITNYTTAWYTKYTAPATPAGTCSSVVAAGTATAALTGLAGNTSYTYKAYSDSGCATELTSTGVQFLTKPSKPTYLLAYTGQGSGNLRIISLWSGGCGALTGWEYTTDDGSTWNTITSTNGLLNHVVTGLSNGTSYTFKVRAVNDTGAGPASDASFSVAPVEPTLTASGVTHNSATLTIRNYILDWYYNYTSPQGGTTCSFAYGSDSGTVTAAPTGLAGNTSYTFKAYSDSSCTSANELASEMFLTTPSQPSKPSVSIGSGKLTISSSVSGGSGALSKWQYTTDDGTNWKDISTTSTTLSHTVTGLTDGTSYTFKVRAVNAAADGVSGGGTSPESAASAATAPQTATLAANNVMATTATLAITDYSGNWYYKRTAPNPSAGTCVAVTGIGTPDARLSDLSPGTSYTFKAYSDNTCDTELTSDATDAEFLTRPGQVSGVTVIASNRSLSVSWTAPSGTVTGYTVQWKSGSGEYDTTNQATSTGTSYTISGLTNDTQYTLRVAAKNATGDGAWSADATGTPDTNVTLTAGAATATSLKLTITNHSGTWYYKYTSPDDPNNCTPVSSTTTVVTGLAANTSYTYTAYSDSGCSTELATATAVKTLLAQVTGVEVVPRDASLSVTWDRPRPGSGSPNYEVQWKSGNQDWDSANRQNTAQNYFTQIPSLSNAVEYTVRVRRITTSPSAVGEWSEPVKGTPAEVALTTSNNVGATTATLVIANYANSNGDVWYYKRTAPTVGNQPYSECSDGLTTGNITVVLTGLSSGTRYTFKAYSDSGCTDAKVLAEVSFTSSTPSNPTPPPVPPEISASAVTATTAHHRQRWEQLVLQAHRTYGRRSPLQHLFGGGGWNKCGSHGIEWGLMYVSTQEFKSRSSTSFSARACMAGLK